MDKESNQIGKELQMPTSDIRVDLVFILSICLLWVFLFSSCKSVNKKVVFVGSVKELESIIPEKISALLESGDQSLEILDEVYPFTVKEEVVEFYMKKNLTPIWVKGGTWTKEARDFFKVIDSAMYFGLLPDHYHNDALKKVRWYMKADSMQRWNAGLWAKAEMILSASYLRFIEDIKYGISLSENENTQGTKFTQEERVEHLENIGKGVIYNKINELEPKNAEYEKFKRGLRNFLDNADLKPYTIVSWPIIDSTEFLGALQKRLFEEGLIEYLPAKPDTTQIFKGILRFQALRNLPQKRAINEQVIKEINFTDLERFYVLAINLNRIKKNPVYSSSKYVIVSIPEFRLKGMSKSIVEVDSRVLIGKKSTPSPAFVSEIAEVELFPSIGKFQEVPLEGVIDNILTDSTYLDQQGLLVLNSEDSVISTETLDWTAYNKDNFPFKIVSKAASNEGFPVIRFHFNSKKGIYLEGKNVKDAFTPNISFSSSKNIQVMEWEKLAHFLNNGEEHSEKTDSISLWISNKEQKQLTLSNRVPVYIRYNTCRFIGDNFVYYNDIYGIDQLEKEAFKNRKY